MPEGKLTALFGFFLIVQCDNFSSNIMALQELSEKFGGTWKMESEENIAKYLEAMGEIYYIFCKILWRKQIHERNRKSTFFLLNFLI